MLFILILGLLASCTSGNSQNAPRQELPTRQALYQSARQAEHFTLVYGSQQPEFAEQYKALLSPLDGKGRYQKIKVISDEVISTAELANCNCLLIGTTASNRHLRDLNGQLPVTSNSTGLQFDGQSFEKANEALTLLYYPSPLNPQMPIHLMTATSEDAVLSLIKNRFGSGQRLQWYGWGYELYQNNRRMLMGHFSENNWQVDQQTTFNFTDSNDTLRRSQHFTFISHSNPVSPAIIDRQAELCEAGYQEIAQFCGQANIDYPMEIHLYASAEEKGLMMYNTSQAHCEFRKGEVHAVFNDLYPVGFTSKENELLLRKLLGTPKVKALERGLSLRFNPGWQREGAPFWAARLFLSGNEAGLEDLIDEKRFEAESELVMDCMSASLVDFLLDKWGKDVFLKKYATWSPDQKELQKLEKAWKDDARQKASQYKTAIAQRQYRRPLSYMKGFNFAHEGYNIYNGYISEKASESLEKLKRLGNNAVAIVPYSYMRSPNEPSFLPIPENAGSENDESIIHSAYQAQRLGMTTLLKPQIWLGRSWPGAVEMKNEEDWNRFFDYYYRWIRHYALMAEIHQMDILCIGVEFAKATLQKNEAWKQIIRKVRGLYSGRLTYAANWGEEFEQCQLWNELDYIGINCYYPLSKKETPDKAELQKNFKNVVQKIEKVQRQYQKPVLFTEIGFRSVKAPWKNPHAEADGRDYAPDHQALCYEIIFEGIKDKAWCEGIFWWKWPSYLGYQGNRNDSFTPNRKAAEQVVREWFGGE